MFYSRPMHSYSDGTLMDSPGGTAVFAGEGG